MDVQVIQEQSLLKLDPQSVKALVKDFNKFHRVKFDEVSIHFVDTPTICQLHEEFFDDPTTTDCISFPMDDQNTEGYRVMGDVFVCPETAITYVTAFGGDPYQETTLYVIHGLLHLIGYDDIEDSDRQEMRSKESNYLSHVEKKLLWLKG